ncbi:MAG TPA: hypothetical protein VM509_02300 [Planctomycetota bacterium]|nr:hypothetical protein [Planctomycetota bacterium]
MRFFTAVLVLALAASSAPAQTTPFDHTVDQPTSNFVWTGTSTLGAIVGNPSNAFQMAGTAALLQAAALPLPVGTAAFNGGDVRTASDLHGKINNPIPIFPPLATIDVVGLHLAVTSPAFAVDAAGNYSALVTFTGTAGTLVVTPFGSAASNTTLVGAASTPTAVAGTLKVVAGNFQLVAPIATSFPFTDPASGASGTINLNGTLRAQWTWHLPTTFCVAKLNSLGCTPSISANGTPKFSATSGFIVNTVNVINNKPGLLLYGFAGGASTPFRGGTLCVQPTIRRSTALFSNGNPAPNDCSGIYSIDMCAFAAGLLGGTPQPALREPGTTVTTQAWGRDNGFSPPNNSTLSNGLTYVVAP